MSSFNYFLPFTFSFSVFLPLLLYLSSVHSHISRPHSLYSAGIRGSTVRDSGEGSSCSRAAARRGTAASAVTGNTAAGAELLPDEGQQHQLLLVVQQLLQVVHGGWGRVAARRGSAASAVTGSTAAGA